MNSEWVFIGLLLISVTGLAIFYVKAHAERLVLRERVLARDTEIQELKAQAVQQTSLVGETKERINAEFKNIVNDLFEDKSKKFNEQNKVGLESILKPLSEKIKDFEKKVSDSYDKESKERFSLVNEIKNLQASSSRISEEAINLTNALKGQTKTQGAWGEMILERVLEKSGLEKGREYNIQVSLTNDEGKRYQPDVIVHLPDNKDVVIDAKVSLIAYERFCSSSDEAERALALKQHILSLRNHIKELGSKDYQALSTLQTLDFVLLFVPVEAAFTLAVQEDVGLFDEALSKNIVIVTPSTLLATLRTIQNIWRYERQNQNAITIAKQAGDLYDKFVAFVDDIDVIGNRLKQAQTAQENAYKKLTTGRGNLVGKVENLKKLGAKTTKALSANLLSEADVDDELVALSDDNTSTIPTSES